MQRMPFTMLVPAQNSNMWTAHSSDADIMDAVLAHALQLLPTLSLQAIAEINHCVGRNYYTLPRAGRTMLDAINERVLQQVRRPFQLWWGALQAFLHARDTQAGLHVVHPSLFWHVNPASALQPPCHAMTGLATCTRCPQHRASLQQDILDWLSCLHLHCKACDVVVTLSL